MAVLLAPSPDRCELVEREIVTRSFAAARVWLKRVDSSAAAARSLGRLEVHLVLGLLFPERLDIQLERLATFGRHVLPRVWME